ncbi:MAG: NAD(P)-binding protein [Nitrospirota bacterium]|jgi:spermidine dehydrogenase
MRQSKRTPRCRTGLVSRSITRRDFLNGVLLGAGAGLLCLSAPARLLAATPSRPGYGGVGDYAPSPGNTGEVIRVFKGIAGGEYSTLSDVVDTGETYDLVVAGGGLSGLGAAWEFSKHAPEKSRCLIIENHPIFGGAAKRNEFMVQGERLIAPQASNAFGVIDRPGIPGYEIYKELGVPTEFEYGELPKDLEPLEFDPTNFGYRLWFTSESIGYHFDGGGGGRWARGVWENKFSDSPYSDKAREDLLRWRTADPPEYKGDDYERWLDGITYKHYIEEVMGLDPAVTEFADPVLASVVGLGSDAISAYTARQVSMPGFREFRGRRSLKTSHWHSFPGGNDAFSRLFVKKLVPDAIEGRQNFEDVHNGRVNFAALDRAANRVRLRLGSSVVGVEHEGSGDGKRVSVVYQKGGRLYSVKSRGVVMATGGRIARQVVRDLPDGHQSAYGQFHVSPILVANVAVTNWRFLYRLGLTACKWFGGFGFGCNIRKPMMVGDYRPPLHPDKPNVLTFYVSFHEPGLPAEEQGERGRRKMLGTSYAEYEAQIVSQMERLFKESGFDAERDVAGIILNRWMYAYLNPQPGFYFGKGGKPAPPDVIRKPFGRIAFAHAELNGHQHWVAAVEEGRRAARQVME